jgi:hypothetical protein
MTPPISRCTASGARLASGARAAFADALEREAFEWVEAEREEPLERVEELPELFLSELLREPFFDDDDCF